MVSQAQEALLDSGCDFPAEKAHSKLQTQALFGQKPEEEKEDWRVETETREKWDGNGEDCARQAVQVGEPRTRLVAHFEQTVSTAPENASKRVSGA